MKIINRYSLVRSYRRKSARIASLPTELAIEITNRCNLTCAMCPRGTMTRPVGLMSLDTFKKIIDQVKGFIELVDFSGGLGEPLMHPDLEEMIAYCRKSKVHTFVSTNITLLTAERTARLLATPPDILLLCIDGASRQSHEAIRVGSQFDKTLANAEQFLEKKSRLKTRRPFTIIQMIAMQENCHEAKDFYAKWKNTKGLNAVRIKGFFDLRKDSVNKGAFQNDRRSCILPWLQLAVSYQGEMSICCFDLDFSDEIGDVTKESIRTLWNSEKIMNYRKQLAKGNKSALPFCGRCSNPIQTGLISQLGIILIDDSNTRKILPFAESIYRRLGLNIAG